MLTRKGKRKQRKSRFQDTARIAFQGTFPEPQFPSRQGKIFPTVQGDNVRFCDVGKIADSSNATDTSQ